MVKLDPTVVQRTLLSTIEAEVDTARSLLDALESELQALNARDASSLEKIIAEKDQLVSRLNQLGHQRDQLLSSLGYTTDRQGLDACIAHYDQQQSIGKTWEELMSLVETCQRQNQVNSGIVQLNQQQVVQALQILRGEKDNADIYDPNGRRHSSHVSHQIAEA
jgi:flagella synthesis protein FlgN